MGIYIFRILKNPFVIISLILFIIPFFWLKPGQMDLGGDASRLYFYDPLAYVKNLSLWTISPEGTGPEFSYQFSLIFSLFLFILKSILKSSWLLITIFNSFSLIVAFLAMSGIVTETLKCSRKLDGISIKYAAIIASLFYLFMPISIYGGWDKALLDHTQIFINPLMVFLLLKYIHSLKIRYLLITLLISFIFSHNFSANSAPKFFAFYPLAFLYLGIYSLSIKKVRPPIRELLLIFILFLGLNSFHLIPQISNLFDLESLTYFKIVSESGKLDALSFFGSISAYIKGSENLIGLAPKAPLAFGLDAIFVLFPVLFAIGAIFNRSQRFEKKQKQNFMLIFIFFLITLFLITANITNVGLNLYKLLFNIPGFTMFRSFFGQWAHVYIFFYSLLLGFSLYYVLVFLKGSKRFTICLFIIVLVIVSGWPLINGGIVNGVLTRSSGVEVQVPIVMDKEYEQVLRFIKAQPLDAKYLSLPLTDHFYQILAGKEGGAYFGPSAIAYLTGKKDFSGYQILRPLSEVFESYVKLGDYDSIVRLLGILNIKYIFHNSDPYIIDNFLDFPYQHMRTFLPTNQNDYRQFVASLNGSEIKVFGDKYHIYKLPESFYLPHIYAAEEIIFSNLMINEAGYINKDFFKELKAKKLRSIFLDKKLTSSLKSSLSIPGITFKKINPTKYLIKVKNAKLPYVLVFSESFNTDWKIFLSKDEPKGRIAASYFDGQIKEEEHEDTFFDPGFFETIGKTPIAEERHILVNGYANSWYILPSDTQGKSSYTFILDMTSQRWFYIGIIVSLLSLVACVLWFVVLVFSYSKK